MKKVICSLVVIICLLSGCSNESIIRYTMENNTPADVEIIEIISEKDSIREILEYYNYQYPHDLDYLDVYIFKYNSNHDYPYIEILSENMNNIWKIKKFNVETVNKPAVITKGMYIFSVPHSYTGAIYLKLPNQNIYTFRDGQK